MPCPSMWPKPFWLVQNGFGLTKFIWSRPKWHGHDQNEMVTTKMNWLGPNVIHFGRKSKYHNIKIHLKERGVWAFRKHMYVFEEFKKRTPYIENWKNIKQKASKIIYETDGLWFNTISYMKEIPHWELEVPNLFQSRHRFFKIGRKFLEKNLTYWVWRRLPWLVIRWSNVTLRRKFLVHSLDLKTSKKFKFQSCLSCFHFFSNWFFVLKNLQFSWESNYCPHYD